MRTQHKGKSAVPTTFPADFLLTSSSFPRGAADEIRPQLGRRRRKVPAGSREVSLPLPQSGGKVRGKFQTNQPAEIPDPHVQTLQAHVSRSLTSCWKTLCIVAHQYLEKPEFLLQNQEIIGFSSLKYITTKIIIRDRNIQS